MTAQRVDLSIDQGTDYRKPLPPILDAEGNPEDITGVTAAMEFRPGIGMPPVLTLTTENGGLDIDGVNGLIVPVIANPVTTALMALVYLHDVKMRKGGKIRRTHEGKAALTPQVTLIVPPAPSPSPSPNAYTDAQGNSYTDANGNAYTS